MLMASAIPSIAQVGTTTPPQGSPKPPEAPADAEARLQKAVGEVRKASDQLAQIQVPMDVEPAFSFRVT